MWERESCHVWGWSQQGGLRTDQRREGGGEKVKCKKGKGNAGGGTSQPCGETWQWQGGAWSAVVGAVLNWFRIMWMNGIILEKDITHTWHRNAEGVEPAAHHPLPTHPPTITSCCLPRQLLMFIGVSKSSTKLSGRKMQHA